MELWIRSQDKELLLKPICFEIDEENKNTFLILIKTARNYNDICIGLYKTKERALEVLDEIQENIVKQGQAIILTDERGIPNGSKFFSYVYEMPKE